MKNFLHIDAYSFGSITVNGQIFTNDILIINGSVFPAWWRKNGHLVQAEDVEEIFKTTIDLFIIGQGKPGFMKSTTTLREKLLKADLC